MPQTLHEQFRQLALYDRWANGCVLRSMDPLPRVDEKLLSIFGHIALAKSIWIDRLEGVDTGGRSPWPAPFSTPQAQDLAPFADSLSRADARLIAFTETTPDLDRSLTYATSAGQQMTNCVADVLTHMVNHATYHRGQLATLVKQLGGVPAATDFVVWVRSGRPIV